ncbi:Uncharacterized protein DBV15_10804 [Temnothorax longispinosus]|uniref:Uncharacterized protein n=1 Tax=Temnothorax longispinosus TaxID=300112 RepID=A0A4S2KBP0_9HYME|nr:Uncharacterized protein DBV15_10804 [Temnothorax longispinosus]
MVVENKVKMRELHGWRYTVVRIASSSTVIHVDTIVDPMDVSPDDREKNEIVVNDYGLLNRCWHASQVYLDTYATRQHSFENERISKRASDRRRRDPECTSELSANQERTEPPPSLSGLMAGKEQPGRLLVRTFVSRTRGHAEMWPSTCSQGFEARAHARTQARYREGSETFPWGLSSRLGSSLILVHYIRDIESIHGFIHICNIIIKNIINRY